jgi:hypothetical protein
LELTKSVGTLTNPLPVPSQHILGTLEFAGQYASSGTAPLSQYTATSVRIESVANGTFSTSNAGGILNFWLKTPGTGVNPNTGFWKPLSLDEIGVKIGNNWWLPTAHGSAGQILQTNGPATQATWVNPPTGNGGWNLVTTTASTYTGVNGQFILVNVGAAIITLPPAVLNHRVAIKWIASPSSSTSVVEVRTAAVNSKIDGVIANSIGYKIWNQWDTVTMISNGTDWFIEA